MIYQLVQAGVGHVEVPPSRIEQIEVIPGLVAVFIVWIIVCQSAKVSFAQLQVVHLVLQYDACLEQSLPDNLVADVLLLISKGYLCQIVFPFMRVVLCTVCHLFQ